MKAGSARMATVTSHTLGEKRGIHVLHDPQGNKSTPSTERERQG